jgi:DNA-directed RNA polymerase subunit RPC12/RpoP
MQCTDCPKQLNDQEEYQVIISNTKEPRCKRCYWLHMNKLRDKYYKQQKGATA